MNISMNIIYTTANPDVAEFTLFIDGQPRYDNALTAEQLQTLLHVNKIFRFEWEALLDGANAVEKLTGGAE